MRILREEGERGQKSFSCKEQVAEDLPAQLALQKNSVWGQVVEDEVMYEVYPEF